MKIVESVNLAKDEDFNDDLQIFITQLQVKLQDSIQDKESPQLHGKKIVYYE